MHAWFYKHEKQGRIQDLSERVARFVSDQKHPDLGTTFFFKIDIFPDLH